MNMLMPLLEASLRGALLIGVLALLRVPLRRLIGSPWFCALWIVVLVRLMVPGSIQSSWSVFNWLPAKQIEQTQTLPVQARVTILPASGAKPEPIMEASVPLAPRSTPPKERWFLIAWIIGASATATMFGWRILKTARMAFGTVPADHPKLLAAFDSIALDLRWRASLRQTDNLEVPALVGLWRPQIWVPTAWLESMSEEDLRHVLLHELGHARRGDLWVQWAFALIQCVHWFNPAVWLAARLAHADRELACDAWVLRRANADEPERYGATLVKAAQMLRSRWHLPPAAITMAMSKGSLFSRVRSIGQFRPVASWRAVLGAMGIAVVLASLSTDRLHAQQGGSVPSTPGAGSLPPPRGGNSGLAPATGGGSGGSRELSFEWAIGSDAGRGRGTVAAAPSGTLVAPPTAPTPPGAPPQTSYQVEVEARFIEMKDAAWQDLGLGWLSTPSDTPEGQLSNRGIIDPSALHLLLSRLSSKPGNGTQRPNDGVDLLSAPRVTMKSGQRGVIEIIREFRYPTEYDPDDKAPEGLRATAFETRNVGITLEAEPTVSADGKTVDLTLIPQIVELVGFTSARTGQPVPLKVDPSQRGHDRILNATMPADMLVQPIFSTRKITTAVTLSSGHTLVIGGLRPPSAVQTADEPRITFILITARVLNSGAAPATGVAPPGAGIPQGAIFGAGEGSGFGLAPIISNGSAYIRSGTGTITLTPGPAGPPAGAPGSTGGGIPGFPGGTPPPPIQVQPPAAIPGASPGGPGAFRLEPLDPAPPVPLAPPKAVSPPRVPPPISVAPRGRGQ